MITGGGNIKLAQSEWFIVIDVQLFDGYRVIPHGALEVRDGHIHRLYEQTPDRIDKRTQVVDGNGQTILPAMLNAHTHVQKSDQLKEALQHGIFVLLDLHSPAETAEQLRPYRDSLEYAYLLTSGPAATVSGGHGTQFFRPPVIGGELSARQFVLDRVAERADFIKIVREPLLNTLSFEQIDTLIQTAHDHEKLVITHISTQEDAKKVVELGTDGLAHVWLDQPASEPDLEELKSHRAFVIPTLLVISKLLTLNENQHRGFLSVDELKNEVKRLFEAGVPLLAGTDAPNLNLNYGDDLFEELALLSAAGLPNLIVLQSATSLIADTFGLADYGRLQTGQEANFVLVEGDPLSSIGDLNHQKSIYRKGKRINAP